jgi:hypothetical protein
MRRLVIAGIVVGFAILGPRLSAPQDRRAGEAFVYEAPEGFAASKVGPSGEPLGEGETLWEHAPLPGHTTKALVHLKRSKMGGTVEPADLAKLAEGMPEMLRPLGLTWKDVRQETRTRPDGARVGLIEGDSLARGPEDFAGGGPVQVHQRRLLFLFPTDEGTALTTAVFAKEELGTWGPALEATIGKARGVAVRQPPPPQWMHFAWGGAGLVLALLGNALAKGRRSGEASTDPENKPAARERGVRRERERARAEDDAAS